MNRLFTLIILLLATAHNLCYAQHANTRNQKYNIILGQDMTQCIYMHTTFDPEYGDSKCIDEILQIGSELSKYWNYGAYQVDSLLALCDVKNMTLRDHLRLKEIYKKDNNDLIVKNHINRSITVYENIELEAYSYSESEPEFCWTLVEGIDTVCGYACHKAECDFRGRHWTAWYTEEIPLSDGPWKFSGLPGLILRAKDSEDHHLFEAFAVRSSSEPINKLKRKYMSTSREQFNKSKTYVRTGPWRKGATMPGFFDADGNPKTIPERLFHNPPERE